MPWLLCANPFLPNMCTFWFISIFLLIFGSEINSGLCPGSWNSMWAHVSSPSLLFPPWFLAPFFPPSLAPRLTLPLFSSHTLTGCLVFPSPPSLSLSSSLSTSPLRCFASAGFYLNMGSLPVFCAPLYLFCTLPMSWMIQGTLRELESSSVL